MADGFHVDLDLLRQTASGISGTVGDVGHRPLSEECDSPDAVGHERLSRAVADFRERWHLGVENLAADGKEIARRLTDCVHTYESTDDAAGQHLGSAVRGADDPAGR